MSDCQVCGKSENLTPPIYQVLVFSPGLPGGIFHITCAEEYRVCDHEGCGSVLRFLNRALEAHPVTRQVLDLWTNAQIDWTVPEMRPWRISHKRQPVGLC